MPTQNIKVTVTQAGSLSVVVRKPIQSKIEVAASGPQGPPGPRGPAGGETLTFEQLTPAATWIIQHNLGRAPLIDLYIAGELAEADVIASDANTTTIIFSQPHAGIAVYS